MNGTSLLEFNQEGALSNMLAMEEHLVGQDNNGLNINSWCFRKHGLIAKNHHLSEMKTLLESENPNQARQLGSFMSKFDVALKRTNPSASEIRELRNEFREIINDPTLEQPKAKCGICSLDKRGSAMSLESNNPVVGAIPTYNTSESSITTTQMDNNGLSTGAKVIIGIGVITIATIVIVALAKRR